MVRKSVMLLSIGLLVLAVAVSAHPRLAVAQGGNPTTTYQLNMRTGPGTTYDTVAVLPAGTEVVMEARNADISWVLAHTVDNSARGWVASLYLTYPPGVAASRLPVSSEIVGAPVAPANPAAPANPPPAVPSSTGANAFTAYEINVRGGPSGSASVLTRIPGNTPLILEARNDDGAWVLARTTDGSVRGWMSSLYLRFSGVTVMSLPVSSESVSVAAGPVPPGTNVNYQGVDMHGYDPAKIQGIDLNTIPIIGQPTQRAHDIFLEGQAKGNDPSVVMKVGDCSSKHWYFLSQFGFGQYNLGVYTNLQDVVNQFSASLGYDSQAAHNGFNANAVLAPEWANPAACQKGESPLACEIRIHKPSVAFIMFGTSDLLVMNPYEFDFYMRQIVSETAAAGVIPILSTFPGNLGFPEKTIIYNQIVVRIAQDNGLPLVNLWLALESLPNHGLEPDGFHLSETPYGMSGQLVAPYLSYGYPERNLVTLQTLDAVWRGSMH